MHLIIDVEREVNSESPAPCRVNHRQFSSKSRRNKPIHGINYPEESKTISGIKVQAMKLASSAISQLVLWISFWAIDSNRK